MTFQAKPGPQQRAPSEDAGLASPCAAANEHGRGAAAIGASWSAVLGASLSACGGGGGGSGTAPTSDVVLPEGARCFGLTATQAAANSGCVGRQPAFESMTPERAARLLNQGGLGATTAEVDALVGRGAQDWFDEQLAQPLGPSIWQWAIDRGYANRAFARSDYGLDQALWWRLSTAQDVLRQRTVLALSEIFVVSPLNMVAYWRQFGCIAWWELLERHCFGNFRDLLRHVTLSPAMGVYLSMRGSAKADASGRQPDENYARELLQLFSIGLHTLDMDGSPASPASDTYGAEEVSELAKVFTGWDVDGFNPLDPEGAFDYWQQPMDFHANRHAGGDKVVLGTRIPAGTPGPQALERALDAVFAHPNVGPFIARQLIQRLVCSNPSPAYVERVAWVFNHNGANPPVRGDLAAVVRAVLADPEARPAKTDPGAQADGVLADGKLREPMLRLLQWLRLSRATSTDGQWNMSDLSGSDLLGQAPLRAPSVFNFFRPGYVPPNTELARRQLVAPEFQVVNESTVIGYVNFLRAVLPFGGNGILPDYTEWLAHADDVPTLIDRLDLCLTGRMLSRPTVTTIVDAVRSITGTSAAQRRNRVIAAFFLVMTCPEYLVQR